MGYMCVQKNVLSSGDMSGVFKNRMNTWVLHIGTERTIEKGAFRQNEVKHEERICDNFLSRGVYV
jgi:hypothetical protein